MLGVGLPPRPRSLRLLFIPVVLFSPLDSADVDFVLVASTVVDVRVWTFPTPTLASFLYLINSCCVRRPFCVPTPPLSFLPARGATASTSRRRSHRHELEHHPVLPLPGVVHAQLHSGAGEQGQRGEAPHVL